MVSRIVNDGEARGGTGIRRTGLPEDLCESWDIMQRSLLPVLPSLIATGHVRSSSQTRS